MENLKDEYFNLIEEVKVGSAASSEFEVTEFFRIFSDISAENGDTPDLDYCPILKEGNGGYRIDGYAFEVSAGDEGDSVDLYIAVCDYRNEEDLPGINSKDIDTVIDGVERFFRNSLSSSFISSLEEASPAFQLAVLIQQHKNSIRRLRVVLLTNGHLRIRKKIFETKAIDDVILHINILDLERYVKIASTGSEPVEIDLKDFTGPIECLDASVGFGSYKSFLFAIPGAVLAEIFAAYGNRLLEQNVRTYLQAITGVNKGILKTIANEPEMFFAYNNGVTATASDVTTCDLPNGRLAISMIKDFQIVNGGQTTASLLYARDSLKKNLDNIYVQVKLSVVDEGKLDEVVPRISEYANTQNKVSLADLASNSPVQIKIERFSREISYPQRSNEVYGTKWFYERARGQYKSLFSYKTPSEKKKLELQYPKSKLITKTDLAKFEYSFDGMPHFVSEGAQKCFTRFSTNILAKLAGSEELNETWFKRAIAKAILFNSLDSAVEKSEWYRSERGYKAQIVTYTIAACADGFRSIHKSIDLDRIWREQVVHQSLLGWMLEEAESVGMLLKSPPENVRNISEFSKKEFCWSFYVRGKAGIPLPHVIQYGIDILEFSDGMKLGSREGKVNRQIDFDVSIISLIPRAHEIMSLAAEKGLASPKNKSALQKLSVGNLNLNRGENNALESLLERLDIKI